MTSGNLLNLKAYQAVKGFKDWMFIDCVDIDICMNLRVHGYDIVRLNYVEMKHQGLNLKQSKKYVNLSNVRQMILSFQMIRKCNDYFPMQLN